MQVVRTLVLHSRTYRVQPLVLLSWYITDDELAAQIIEAQKCAIQSIRSEFKTKLFKYTLRLIFVAEACSELNSLVLVDHTISRPRVVDPGEAIFEAVIGIKLGGSLRNSILGNFNISFACWRLSKIKLKDTEISQNLALGWIVVLSAANDCLHIVSLECLAL